MVKYTQEYEEGYTPLLAIEEASRCLLCHDAPCSSGCPAETDPGKFIRSLRFKNIKGAIETIRTNNIFGSTCARVCPTEKYCQLGCSRTDIDRPIEIGKLQKFLTDYEQKTKFNPLKPVALTNEKVAIIGSGPSGLTAAAELAKKGYQAVVYEKNEKFGGWLRYGIPPFRLGEDILDYELSLIEGLGVKMVNNTEYGKDITKASLEKDGFKAILVATGFSEGKMLDEYKKLRNAETAASFLAKLKMEPEKTKVDKNYIVIGGGDVAMDVATSVKLRGAEHVKVVAIESLETLPASRDELAKAKELNISIFGGYTPCGCSENGVDFINNATKDKLSLTADKIILAIGQKSGLPEDLTKAGNNVFISGDLDTGDKTVVWSVKSGKQAAAKIIAFLGGK